MLALRKIAFSFLALGTASAISEFSFASAGSVKTSLDLNQNQGNASSLNQESSATTAGKSQSIEISSPTLKKYWTVLATVKMTTLDSSQLDVKSASGKDVHLDESKNQTTTVGTGGFTFSNGTYQSTLKYGSSLDSSLFQTRNLTFENNYNLNSQTTSLGLLFSKAENDRPENYFFDNYFSDGSLNWKPRPTRVTKNKWQGSVDQLWNDNYKTRTELFYLERNQVRPQSAGLIFKNSYSFNSRQIGRVDLGTAADDKSQDLLDERGYFQMNWIESSWTQAINFNLWCSASYGVIQEIESEPRLSKKTQTGSDVYGLKLKYFGKAWTADIKWESLESNTNFRSQQFNGALEWEI